ncbi:Probable pre-mRNA-splicing factor ATP-dependent RNA helicase DEAH5 (DEAH RNA helicase homolog PRP22) [Durusdinium trenchii]|uniref:RNA helicase n=1 Tax=Durusdinium trenchii TaxID=1381693 RepID=A0ABP0IL17_9DINO
MEKLDLFSLVAKVTQELDVNLGVGTGEEAKALAEFLVTLAKEHAEDADHAGFIKALHEQDEDFPELVGKSVFQMVKAMHVVQSGRSVAKEDGRNPASGNQKLPGLAKPDEKRPVRFGEGRDSITEQKLRKLRHEMDKLDQRRKPRSEPAPPRFAAGREAVPERRGPGPHVGEIYKGVVTNVDDSAGVFVCLDKFADPSSRSGKKEGMVHRRSIAHNSGLKKPSNFVRSGDTVYVKVISILDGKMVLSMRDVDQNTGADLLPMSAREIANGSGIGMDKPHGPHSTSGSSSSSTFTSMSSFRSAEKPPVSSLVSRKRKMKHSEEELWEIRQLINSGVLPVEAYPTFDEEQGVLNFDETEEELEIEKTDAEPAFLKGQTELSTHLSQIKIVKNPEGSMSRAAETASSLARERRELKQAQEQQLLDAIPKNLNRPWQDPMSDNKERSLAAELRGVGLPGYEVPEWKQQAEGQNASFGIVSTKSMKEQRESLPIFKLKNQLLKAFAENQILIVIGETGSGKTTQMTQYLAEMGYAKKGIIGCTQPRRVAAVSVAKRVAEEYGCRVGQEVGYTIRFEDCTGPETRLKYMTDGMLMREYLMDGDLKRYSAIMLDEAHERTIHTDVLFSLLKKLLKRRRDLRLIVTSATLDADKFSKYFYECPIFTIPGRSFPVEILYTKEPETDYLDASLVTVMQIHINEPAGDILLFLTGQEEIDTACEVLYQRMKKLRPKPSELIILPAYGSLPSEMQSKIFEPAPPGARKLVVATNIAEASITLDGVYYVVDPGYAKQNVYNPKLGMDSLVVVPISQASARQRAGRAGRTGPGKCFRLYTELAFKTEMLPTSVPELQRTNLGSVVLQLKAMGINDLLNFDFMDPPPAQTMIAAMENLYALGALDEEGLLTKMGRKMAEFPLDPVLAKTLISSVELGCAREVLTVVAMLSVENVFYRPKEKQAQADQKKARFHQPEGDHMTLLAVYEAWENSRYSKPWCYENFVQARSIGRARDIRKQLLGIMDRHRMPIESCGKKFQAIQMAIASGFFTHTAKRDPQEGYRTIEGQPVFIHPGSALFNRNPEWVIYHELVLTTKEYMRNVMLVQPKWLTEVAPNFFKTSDPRQLSKRKRKEKIEPLTDRFNPPNAWRLSRRQPRRG